MDHLPDNVLLNIFSHLDLETLENVEHVCQRWVFLAHTPELWLFKCKKLCERERLGKLEILITEASTNEIDWKQAFIELSEFTSSESVRQVRLSYLQSLKANAKAVRPRNINFKDERLQKKLQRRKTTTAKSCDSATSYVNFYVKPDDELDNQLLKESSYLTHLTLKAVNENKKKKKEPHPYLDDIFEFKLAQSDGTYRPNANQKKPYFKYSENIDEVLKDFKEIKTELVPSKDLLNPILPNYRLKWKAADEELRPFETIVHNLSPITKVQSLNNHRKKITCIDYDKNRVVTGSLDQLIFVYDFKNGTCLGKLEGHKGGIKCVYILKNRLCSGSWDMQLIIWNMIRFEMVTILNTNQDSISCIYFDMKYLIYGSHDKSIYVWQFKQGYTESADSNSGLIKIEDVMTFDKLIEYHKSGITCLTYDGINCIVSGNTQGHVLLIDINGILLRQLSFTRNFEPITSIKLVGALIIGSTIKGKVVFWNRRNNRLESIIKCNDDESPVHTVCYYNKKFYTAGDDKLVKEWDMASLTCIRQFKAHEGPVFDMIVAEDKIISCGFDKAIIWNMNTKKEVNIMALSDSGR